MEDRSASALVALRRILRATELSSKTLARESGLTASQLITLQLVGRIDDATPGAVAREAGITQATVTALIDKLERRGLVTRERDTEDRRRVLVRVTPEGRAALAGAPDMLQDLFETRFERLYDWEQASVVAALERVAALLDAEAIDAAPLLDVGEIDRHAPSDKPGKR